MKLKRADIERILIVCAAALVVALAIRGNGQTTSDVLVDNTEIPIEHTIATSGGDTQSTVCFYEDGDGYLVPVTRQIAKTDGVAKATLALMVKDSQNDLQAARLGLRTVIPEGTTFDIDIADGRANVNVSREAFNCASAAQETLMVDAITNALTCFATVDEVTLEFDGQRRSKLTYGTDVSGVYKGGNLNLESVETFAADQKLVQLYFPSQSGRMLVPVTRAVFSDADLSTAMLELAKGPQDDSGLENALPENCGVKSVTMKDGVVTVNFSKEFRQSLEETDGGRQAVRAILFTCSQFPGVKKVEVLVEGERLEQQPEAVTTFVNMEDDIAASYPGVIEID